MTIAIIVTLVILFVITWIVIAVNLTEPLPRCCLNCLHGGHKCMQFGEFCCDHYGIGTLRKEIADLRMEKIKLDRMYQAIQEDLRSTNRERYFAIDKERQDLVDIIIKSKKTAEELVRELDLPQVGE